MSITLGISTSTPKFEVVLSDGQEILFNSRADVALSLNRNLPEVLQTGLKGLGLVPNDLKYIVLDIGPGGTSAVRTGVAFGNGLSYSLGIPVFPIMSLELMGIEAWEQNGVPVLSVIKSVKDNAYIGLYDGTRTTIKYGNWAVLTKMFVSDLDAFSLAGIYAEEIATLYPDKKIHKSLISMASMAFFIKKNGFPAEGHQLFPNFAIPITEEGLDSHE
jgi:tRNA threonylcarbamoyl adenosine modification protein YeaZ